MAKASIGGVEYEVAPLKWKKLRAAAPLIDKIQAAYSGGPDSSLESITGAGDDLLRILVIGIDKPDVTFETLEDAATFEDIIGLQPTFTQILAEAGLRPKPGAGEEAPAAPAPAESPSQAS